MFLPLSGMGHSAFSGVKERSELPKTVNCYLAGEFQLDDFLTHTIGLDDINDVFDLMHEGKSIRSAPHYWTTGLLDY